MSESVDPLAGERCADCPGAFAPEPVPVLGPYLGVVGAVLCILVGAFLLLAPYAFDYRDGAAKAPRATVVDLATGAAVAAVGVLTAALFGASLARRLRPAVAQPGYGAATYLVPVAPGADQATQTVAADGPNGAEPRYTVPGLAPDPETGTAGERIPEPRPSAAPAPTPPPAADPAGALRDLLTPLVAALAADLRARESGETEGKQL
jgi:hypothetical protein